MEACGRLEENKGDNKSGGNKEKGYVGFNKTLLGL